MPKVYYVILTSRGKDVGEVVFKDGRIDLSGVQGDNRRADLELGVYGRPESGVLFPADGMKFLEELPWAFSGSYATCSKVMSREE